ncbi:hypothetical protein, partial [Streptomyces californicus]|uniref:hypothetical protein n=1 Tax=Streptomyces californicus TaxID=67351 RepID=UPI00365AF747
LMTFSNVQNLTVLIVLKLTDSLSKNEREAVHLYKEAESIAKDSGLNIWSIPGYVDDKNGFNMDVVTDDVKNTISSKVDEAIEVIDIFK